LVMLSIHYTDKGKNKTNVRTLRPWTEVTELNTRGILPTGGGSK